MFGSLRDWLVVVHFFCFSGAEKCEPGIGVCQSKNEMDNLEVPKRGKALIQRQIEGRQLKLQDESSKNNLVVKHTMLAPSNASIAEATPQLTVRFFDAPSTVSTESNWIQAFLELGEWCEKEGYEGGVPTGHHANKGGEEVRGVYCFRGEGVTPQTDIWSNYRSLTPMNVAFKVTHKQCRSQEYRESKAKPGYIAGFANGKTDPCKLHNWLRPARQSCRGGNCFKAGPFIKHYDATFVDHQGNARELNYADGNWGNVMKEIGDFCRYYDWQWGFPNGEKSGRLHGAYCFKQA